MSTIYCTYLTVYFGNKLPPFYIGFTSIKKIEKGYHGSVSSKLYKNIWKMELKKNPHLFKTIILTEHDVIIDAKEKETYLQQKLNVVKNPLYINCHISGKDYLRSKESYQDQNIRNKISIKIKDKWNDPAYKLKQLSKNYYRDPEYRKKQSIAQLKISTQISQRQSGSGNSFYGKKHTKESNEKRSKSLKESFAKQNPLICNNCARLFTFKSGATRHFKRCY